MPKVGKKKYPYTKKGKAAAAKARKKQKLSGYAKNLPLTQKPKPKQKRRKGPMPKVNPEFAKEMEEGNKPKQLKSKGLSKGALEYQRRQEALERTSDAEARQKVHEEYGASMRERGVTTEDWDYPLIVMEGVNKGRRELAARRKARQDRKKRQGTMGAAPKKKTTQRKREQSAADALKKKRQKAKNKRGTTHPVKAGRFFRGRG